MNNKISDNISTVIVLILILLTVLIGLLECMHLRCLKDKSNIKTMSKYSYSNLKDLSYVENVLNISFDLDKILEE